MSPTDGIDHSLRQTTLISAIYPIGPAAIILMPLIVGGLIDSYGFSDQQAGAVATAEGLGLVLGLLTAALWVRSVGWRLALFAGLALYAALNFGSPLIEGHTGIVILRALSGFVGGGVFAIVVAALGDNREPDRAFGIAQAVQGLVMGALFVWAPALMSDTGINLEETTIGYALGVSQLAAIFGALLAAAAAQRFGRVIPMLIALIGQLWVLWVLVGQFSASAFYAGACLYQGLYVMATAYQLGVISQLDSKGKFIVVMTALQGLGAALGPSIAAGLINDGDYSSINMAAATTLIVSLGLFLFLAHSANKHKPL